MKGLNNVTIDNDNPTTFRCLISPVPNGTFIQWTRDGVEDPTIDNELKVDPSQTGVYCLCSGWNDCSLCLHLS